MLKKPQTWLLILFTTGAAFTARTLFSSQDELFEQSKDFPEILHLVDLAYVDEVDMNKLMPGAFQGVLEKVDENASYIPPGSAPQSLAKEVFFKTGMVVGKRSGYAWIQTVASGSPGDEAGMKPGDYLRSMNGKNTRQLSLYAIRSLFTRAEKLQCAVINPDKVEDDMKTVTPGSFKPPPMAAHAYLDQIHLLQIPFFYDELAEDLRKNLDQIGPEARVLIDLRQNALGDDKALQILAGHFLARGKLASWVNARKETTDVVNPTDGTFKCKALYILLGEETSQAAESFSAVAQEQKAATLIGKTTLGRPTHYRFLPLQNGGHLELSVESLQLVSGKVVTGTGIKPDTELKDPEESDALDPLLDAALEVIRKDPLKKAS